MRVKASRVFMSSIQASYFVRTIYFSNKNAGFQLKNRKMK